jgi:hypothetical protein
MASSNCSLAKAFLTSNPLKFDLPCSANRRVVAVFQLLITP